MKNKIDDLRNHLFATLEDLRDKDKPMDIERAEAIAKVAQVMVNSAKVENDFLRITGGDGSGFIPVEKTVISPALPGGVPRLVKGSARA